MDDREIYMMLGGMKSAIDNLVEENKKHGDALLKCQKDIAYIMGKLEKGDINITNHSTGSVQGDVNIKETNNGW